MPLPLSHLSLDSGQMSLELVLCSRSDQIPPGYAGSTSPGQLCLPLWHFAKPGPEHNPAWAPTTHLTPCGTPHCWLPAAPAQQGGQERLLLGFGEDKIIEKVAKK